MSFAYEFAEKESSDHLRSNTKATFRPRNMLTGEAAAVCSKVGKQHTSETHVKMVEDFQGSSKYKGKKFAVPKTETTRIYGDDKVLVSSRCFVLFSFCDFEAWLSMAVLYRVSISQNGGCKVLQIAF